MAAYYNEIDPYAAQWLRNLISAGLIAPGDVDERSIEDVCPGDLTPYTQCHFFAGIGVWSAALRGIGWSDDARIWTGSCPCQPFSAAGKGGGFDDERHLWPAFYHLIVQCQPGLVVGEQVASKDGLAWLDLVHTDMEAAEYAFGAVDLCAAGVGAPHIRQRLYWVADATGSAGAGERGILGTNAGQESYERPQSPYGSTVDRLDIATGIGRERFGDKPEHGKPMSTNEATGGMEHPKSNGRQQRGTEPGEWGLTPGRSVSGMADADGRNASAEWEQCGRQFGQLTQNGGSRENEQRGVGHPGPTNGLWRDVDWLFCRDGKWRPVEPGTFPLAHGATSRVGRLRAYGNAINLAQAEAFLAAALT